LPTTADPITDPHSMCPKIIEEMKSFEAPFSGLAKMAKTTFEAIGAAILAVAESPPSPGYEPYYVRRGVDPVMARMMARQLVHRGRRIEAENQRHGSAIKAIRFLANPGRKRSSIPGRAAALLAVWHETSIIETIFRASLLDREMEFVEALKGAARGEDIGCESVTAIAAVLQPHLVNPSGPKIKAASAAHEFFLENVEGAASHGYTWSDIEGDFVDEETAATRREFAEPRFDPRPAYRRLKARESNESFASPHARTYGACVFVRPTNPPKRPE
jgi:hypothetical protein